MSSLVSAGLALAAIGFGGRYLFRASTRLADAVPKKPLFFTMDSLSSSRYYRGGFEPRMSRREASLILAVSPSAPAKKIKDAHKRIMLLNHPDRGGSPYLAAKINEAKDYLDSNKS